MSTYEDALGRLRTVMAVFGPEDPDYRFIVPYKDEVLARFGPVFSMEHVDELTADEFTPFLYPQNNHHWSHLYRTGLKAADDINRLRRGLKVLLDEQRPIATRFTEALRGVPGMGKGIASAILTVAYPERYGVWNNTSEAALRELGIWPQTERGSNVGERYERVNELLVRLRDDLGIDLWTLDSLFFRALKPAERPDGESGSQGNPSETDGPSGSAMLPRFALEAHLEEFLVENWGYTDLAREWEIFAGDDEPLAGNQFPTDIGRIDILAKHRTEPRWLVIELKRAQSSDATVGQVLRYMGWVQRHVAEEGDGVEGLIVARDNDARLLYALEPTQGIRMMQYDVSFTLRPAVSVS